jgi:hypothetical protein
MSVEFDYASYICPLMFQLVVSLNHTASNKKAAQFNAPSTPMCNLLYTILAWREWLEACRGSLK